MGQLHRTDGAAGSKDWYIHGQLLTEDEHTLLAFVL
jgi:hypothetical protein